TTETCNSLDDNCDGAIDDGNPDGGGPCGVTTGACTAGTETCSAGAIQCVGGTGPSLEVCDTLDNNCDGAADEGFDLMNDVRNCGGCGTVCNALPHAFETCNSGTCAISGCVAGWVDLDGLDSTGCEYPCDGASGATETCNGLDDDCDGTIDIGVTPPANFCSSVGECSGTAASCNGTTWVCTYADPDYEVTEVSCDGKDNDCDGATDEPFPTLGNPCQSSGTGACITTGNIVCSTATTVGCNATPAAGGTEICNGLDDDCDGIPDDNLPLSAFATVNIPWAGGTSIDVMQYEASRPDAAPGDEGSLSNIACSKAGVLPWTGVTRGEAAGACAAMGASWQLCDSADWQDACEGPTGNCGWGYDSACSVPAATTCNGVEFDSDGGTPGDQDALYPTASATFAMCFADWGGAGVIYDLSGNAKEWTNTLVGTGIYTIRGGSYNNIEPGRTCDFDYTAAHTDLFFPNTGFRCCRYNP
ncbi:MAG: hypothetical protein JRH11_28540, partial [Deltaproteobacteria bacterium]|nr:hypothetical protein [Deltaproteobacteria bacterium]